MEVTSYFIAENNGYGEATTFEYASSCDSIADRAKAYNIPGVQVDGKDLLAVYKALQKQWNVRVMVMVQQLLNV